MINGNRVQLDPKYMSCVFIWLYGLAFIWSPSKPLGLDSELSNNATTASPRFELPCASLPRKRSFHGWQRRRSGALISCFSFGAQLQVFAIVKNNDTEKASLL